jgi:hypothetical protein
MLRKANNVFSVLLGDVNVTTAALNSAVPVGTVVSNLNLPTGAIVITDAGLRRLDAAAFAALATDAQFFVIQGRGAVNPLMKSPILTKGKIKFSIAPHKRAQQQSTSVGFNGTTGALPVANNTNFFIKIRKRDNDAANRSQPFSLFAGPVRTDGSGTQAELASMLVKNGYLNFKNEPANQYLRFETLCDNAGAATTGATGTLAATTGSLFVSATVSGSAEFAVGSYVRFGTATTAPVYKVVAVAAAGITLDSPYVGTTGTFAAGAAEFITPVLASTANFGVRMTGNVDPFDVNQWRDYYANRFTVSFSDTNTPITHLQGAFNGNGVWQQVAMDEYLNYGFEGENNQLAVPSIPRDQVVKIPGVAGNTVDTSKYSALNIAWEESISGLVSMDGGKGNVIVYFNLDNSAPGTGVVTATAAEANAITTLGLVVASFNEV